jgi:hypothetical protein
MSNQKLTLAQEKFCEEYVLNGDNALQAAKNANYLQPNGSARYALSKPSVVERINTLKEIGSAREGNISNFDTFRVTKDYKRRKLYRMIEQFLPADVERDDPEDIQSGYTKKIQPSQALIVLKSLAELNKMDGDYAVEKHAHAIGVMDMNKFGELVEQLDEQYKKEY